jgi:hypothetical protein
VTLYEKVKDMSFDEMAEFMVHVVFTAMYATEGRDHLAKKELIKSHPMYQQSVEIMKETLMGDANDMI